MLRIIAFASVILALLPLTARPEDAPIDHWVFQSENADGQTIRDLAGGDHNAVVSGEARFTASPPAVLFDAAVDSVGVPGVIPSTLPSAALSVEAWVAIDKGTQWGGIVGCLQDNGSYEKGWVLGYNNTQFTFAVSTGPKMTYLAGSAPFGESRWRHVVGVYDGAVMRLYVDGRLDGFSSDQSGPIDYPDAAPYQIGAYRDDNEFYRLEGALHEIAVYSRALTPAEVAVRYDAKKDLFAQQEVEFLPVSRWVFSLDHCTTETVRDLVGDHDALLIGAATLGGDPPALNLDGEDSFAEAAGLDANALPDAAFTAEAWMQPERLPANEPVMGLLGTIDAAPAGWELGIADDRFAFTVATQGALTTLASETRVETARWWHLVAVYDGARMTLFVNGQEDAASRERTGPLTYPGPGALLFGAAQGAARRFRGRIHDAALYQGAMSPDEILARYEAGAPAFPEPVRPVIGPWLEFTGPDSAIVRWQTRDVCLSILEYGQTDPSENALRSMQPTRRHRMTLRGLRPESVYRYRLRFRQGDSEVVSPTYPCETFFNYTRPRFPRNLKAEDVSPPGAPGAPSGYFQRTAQDIVRHSGARQGLCIVVGAGEGQLAWALASQGDFRVTAFDTDPARVDALRNALREAGVYGTYITVRAVDSFGSLPVRDGLADLVVSENAIEQGGMPAPFAEVRRVLRPGGAVCVGHPRLDNIETPGSLTVDALREWFGDQADGWRLVNDNAEGLYGTWTAPAAAGAGVWSHQYGTAANTANGGETLADADATDELEVRWLGRPGPRAGVDRGVRFPAPLAVGGRLFTQGMQRVIALNHYNGTILWSLEIPDLVRYNVPRDCSNWCADEDAVYMAVRDVCWQVDAATGNVRGFFGLPGLAPPAVAMAILRPNGPVAPVVRAVAEEPITPLPTPTPAPPPEPGAQSAWGFIAVEGDHLLGTVTRQDAFYTDYWGPEAWYDSKTGPSNDKVCGDMLFALDKPSGDVAWAWRRGLVIHSTITIADSRVAFVECRNPKVLAAETRRIALPELWRDQYLVCLDARTGLRLWERAIDTRDGTVVFYMLGAGGRFIIASSSTLYEMTAFDAATGEPDWTARHNWISDNHGQHMQHPAVSGGRIFLRPALYNLQTGAAITGVPAPPHQGGCATFAATSEALLYRGNSGCISLWDIDTGAVTTWDRLRPACWLSTIPAGGMVLSPEGGGGCSCGNWMETSVGFGPVNAND